MSRVKRIKFLLKYTDPHTGVVYTQSPEESMDDFEDRVFALTIVEPLMAELGCSFEELHKYPEYYAAMMRFNHTPFRAVTEE
jgi:hypothetical protein